MNHKTRIERRNECDSTDGSVISVESVDGTSSSSGSLSSVVIDDELDGVVAPVERNPCMLLPPAVRRRKISRLEYSNRTLQEIVETERTFVHDVSSVATGYLKQMKRERVISLPRISILFGNLEEILTVHKHLLSKMELNPTNSSHVSKCIYNCSAALKQAYIPYCENYPKSIELLGEAEVLVFSGLIVLSGELTNVENRELRQWFDKRKLANSHALPLAAYLLKPVQRIMKYHLLLEVGQNELFATVNKKHPPETSRVLLHPIQRRRDCQQSTRRNELPRGRH